ncbi:lysoplasmalogenase [Aeromicrobium sp. zg-629]|nr:lysoplasmalogenase [Aeromicrobium senzhongii]
MLMLPLCTPGPRYRVAMNPLRSPWLAAFGVAVVVHLALVLAQAQPWESISKCLIAPLLIAWVIDQGGPRIIAAALFFCLLGDLFLEIDGFFIAGMAAFAIAHGCFVTFFVRHGALASLRRRLWIPAALAVGAVLLLAWVWTGLESGLRVPVLVYALLLSTTAATALSVDLRAGLGALLFLFSDGLIAARIAERVPEDAVAGGFVVMLTYSAALFLLATAAVRLPARPDRTPPADSGTFLQEPVR